MQVPHLLSFRVVIGSSLASFIADVDRLAGNLGFFWLHKTRGNDMNAHNKGRVMCIRKFNVAFFLCTHNIKDPYRHLRCKANTGISRRVLTVPPHFSFLMRERSGSRYRILGRWVDTCIYNCKGRDGYSTEVAGGSG